MTKEAFFDSPIIGRIAIANEILLKDGSKLEFKRPKELGLAVGGVYVDDEGQEFMVKTGYYNSQERQFFHAHVENRYEALLNDLARGALIVGRSPKTMLGKYNKNGSDLPCFISQIIPDYKDIVNFPEVDKKGHRVKFHPDYVFNALIANDDIHDNNLGIDGDGNPVNIDYGFFPPFMTKEQEECKDRVHQVASFIGHQSLIGKQITKKRFFGYDEQINPLKKREEEFKSNDISYYDIVLGAKNISDKKGFIVSRCYEEVESIKEDDSIPADEKQELVDHFSQIAQTINNRIENLEENFSRDFVNLDSHKKEFSDLKWRHHPKFREIFDESRIIDANIAKRCYEKQIQDICHIIGGDDLDFETSKRIILETNLSDLDVDQQNSIKKFAAQNFSLHTAVMNKDVEIAKYLIDNEISDINSPCRQRNYGNQYHMMSALSIAIATHNDAMYYDHQYHTQDNMIDLLHNEFVRKTPESQEEGYISDMTVFFVPRISEIAFRKYETVKENIEDQASSMISKQMRKSFKATSGEKLEENNKDLVH